MRTLCIVILTGVVIAAQGQYPERIGLDSMDHHMGKARTTLDSVHVLNAVARASINPATDTAIALALRASALAQRIGNDLEMAHALSTIGTAAQRKGDLTSARTRLGTSLKLYDKLLREKRMIDTTAILIGKSTALNRLGVVLKDEGRFAEALASYRESLDIKTTIGDEDGLDDCHINIAVVYARQGNYPAALEHHYTALRLREGLGDRKGVASSHNAIGQVFCEQRMYEKALGEYTTALDINLACKEQKGVANTYSNIAYVREQQGDYEEALRLYALAIPIRETIGDKRGLAGTYTNMGSALAKLGRTEEARTAHERSLEQFKAIGTKQGIASAMINLGNIEVIRLRPKLAYPLLREGIRIAEEIGALPIAYNGHVGLVSTDSLMGDYRSALHHLRTSSALRDSMHNEDKSAAIARLQTSFEYGQKMLSDSLDHMNAMAKVESERTIERLRADQNRNRALGLAAGALLLFGGGLLYFRNDRRRRKADHERDVAELRTKALRSQMNPHFIGNAMQSIHRYMDNNDGPKAGELLVSFSTLMRAVLENSVHQQVPLEEDMDVLKSYLEFERARTNEKFDYQVTVDPALSAVQAQVPPLVVQPFLENAIQHGLMNKEGRGRLQLTAERRGDGMRITVEDDGVGRAGGTAKAAGNRSLSTGITRERLDQLRRQTGWPADFRIIDLPQGTRVEIDLPLGTAA